MTAWDWWRAIVILGPIGLLVAIGFVIAIQSRAGTRGAQTVGEMISRTAVQVGGYIAGLAVIHRLIGHQLPAIW